jgi:hypothetical protein
MPVRIVVKYRIVLSVIRIQLTIINVKNVKMERDIRWELTYATSIVKVKLNIKNYKKFLNNFH